VQQIIAFSSKNQQFSMEAIVGTCFLFLFVFALLNIKRVYH
jgi:hypothetical protein